MGRDKSCFWPGSAWTLIGLLATLPSQRSCVEWDSSSLLQPGPCPIPATVLLDATQQLRGQWAITQLPRQFPSCCHQPLFEVADARADRTWIKAAVNWSPCSGGTTSTVSTLAFRMHWNSLLSNSLLMELPWPYGMVGVASFNWVSGDPKTHAVAYVCVSLLLEHLVIPMILSRPGVNADDVQTQRLKWILVKQGLPPAWSLMDTVGSECNTLSPNPSQGSNQTLARIPNDSATPATPVGASYSQQWPAAATTPDPALPTIDPDQDAEWLTTDSINSAAAGRNPTRASQPPSDVWPSIYFSKLSPESAEVGPRSETYDASTEVASSDAAQTPLTQTKDRKMAH